MKQRQPTEDRQRQIAEAALNIIASQGLGKFTTSAIAREVGLAEGTIFRHFSSKQDIVHAAIELMVEKLSEGFPPEHDDPLQRLKLFLNQRITLLLSHPGVFRAFFSDELAHAAGDEGAAQVERMKRQSSESILECLQEAAAQNRLRIGLDPKTLVNIVQGTLHALIFNPSTPSDPKTKADTDNSPSRSTKIFHTILQLIGS